MIDPMLSMAASVQASAGVYALLLGSGVSRSAGIPTGWEVVDDLVRRIAVLHGENCGSNPQSWFKGKFGKEPNYSDILEDLAPSPSERRQLLSNYFEPTDEERARGLKLPTASHKSVAQLVTTGSIRLIVTTNFDRLLEIALRDIGVEPIVISTPDAVVGAPPIVHSRCTIVKIHGDYLDSRIRNTRGELEKLDPEFEQLLHRVFDEFGLIICGWSSEWDAGLRSTLERCQNHRFTTYWTTRSRLNPSAESLIALRRAKAVKISDADSFFRELETKVAALQDFARPHPLSAPLAVAQIKRYLPDERQDIPFHDLLKSQAERAYGTLLGALSAVKDTEPTAESLKKIVQECEGLVDVVVPLLACCSYWGNPRHLTVWTSVLERIASPHKDQSRLNTWTSVGLYPALILLYGAGIAALANGKFDHLSRLLTIKLRKRNYEVPKPAALVLYTWNVIRPEDQERLFTVAGPAKLSEHLFQVLRDPLREYLPDDDEFEDRFDWFEYLLALVHFHQSDGVQQVDKWLLNGRFAWQGQRPPRIVRYSDVKEREPVPAVVAGIVESGLFGASSRLPRFQDVKAECDKVIDEIQKGRGFGLGRWTEPEQYVRF